MTQIDDDDDLLDEEPEPQPRASTLTVVLAVLNVLAVLAFAFLLLMDLSRRQQWAYASFRYDLAILGLPLEEEASGYSATHDVIPKQSLDPEWLKEAYQKRGGKGVQEKFREVGDVHLQRIRPQDLRLDVLEEVFKNVGGEPVETLNAEIQRLRKTLPGALETAADAATSDPKTGKARTEAAKRAYLQKLLLPLAWSTAQVEALDEAMKAVKPGIELDKVLKDAAQRRLTTDIIALMEEYRPPAAKERTLEQVVALLPAKGAAALAPNRYAVKMDKLNELLDQRLAETLADTDWQGRQRYDLEKRRTIGFLLFALSRVKKPDGQPLYSGNRAAAVVGIREVNQAADSYALVMGQVERRMFDAIQRDRGKYLYPLETRVHNPTLFAEKLVGALTRVHLDSFWGKARDHFIAKRAALEKAEQMFDQVKGQVVNEVKGLLAGVNLTIPKDKAGAFDAEVGKLVDRRLGERPLVILNPDRFAADLAALARNAGAQLRDRDALQKSVTKHFTAKVGKLQGAEQVLTEVKALMKQQKLSIPEDVANFKVRETAFEREVLRLVDNREIGFVGRHHDALGRLQDVIKRIEDQQIRLNELVLQEKELERQHEERKGQVAETAAKLIKAREKTLRMAEEVRQLEDELIRAQIELADADLRNQLMERRIRQLERARKGGKQ